MSQENISDLEYLFWGGGQDAKYAALKAFAAAGVDAADVLDGLPPTGGTTGQVLAKASGTDYDTEWGSNLPPSPAAWDNTNYIAAASAQSSAGVIQEEGFLNGSLVYLPSGTIENIGIRVTNAGASGSVIRLGVYAMNGLNGTLVWDAGTIDGTNATAQEISGGTASIESGWYALVAVSQGNPASRPTIYRNTGAASFTVGTQDQIGFAAAFISGIGVHTNNVTGALPATIMFSAEASRSQQSARVAVKGTWL